MFDNVVPLRRADRLRTLWKNGTGITEEVAVDDGARPGWRISIADLGETPSTFSTFPDRDRIFTVVGPHGVDIELSGAISHVAPLHPFAFEGESSLRCIPAGSTSAFNVMVDRKSYRAKVTIHDLHGLKLRTEPDRVTAVYVHNGRIDAEGHTANSGDCLLMRRAGISIAGIGTIVLVEIAASGRRVVAARAGDKTASAVGPPVSGRRPSARSVPAQTPARSSHSSSNEAPIDGADVSVAVTVTHTSPHPPVWMTNRVGPPFTNWGSVGNHSGSSGS